MESQYIYIGTVFGLLAICMLLLRCKKDKKRRATLDSTHEQEHVYHEQRAYVVYTIPQTGTTLQSQSHQQYPPAEPLRNNNDDLPPKYEDLVLQNPSNPENTSSYPPRYNF